MTNEQAAIRASEHYLAMLGAALGDAQFKGGTERRAAQLIQIALDRAVEDWPQRNTHEPQLVWVHLTGIHRGVVQIAETARKKSDPAV